MSLSFACARSALLLPIITIVVVAAACSMPLASRRAQVLEPGEWEAGIGAAAGALGAQTTFGGETLSYVPALGTQASLRIGVAPNIDFQLRVLDILQPEASFGWQLFGDPTKNDFAFTLTGGAAPLWSVGFSNATGAFNSFGLSVPLQLLVDVPIGDGAITLGTRTIASGSRADAAGTVSYNGAITQGVTASWTLPLGNGFFVRPELAASAPLRTDVPLGQGALAMIALAAGYEFRL